MDLLKPKELPKIPQESTPTKFPDNSENPQIPNVEKQEPLNLQEHTSPEVGAISNPIPPQIQSSQADHVSALRERVPTPHTKTERLVEIEKIMSMNLEEIYSGLSPEYQIKVKVEGEKAATQIEVFVEQGKNVAKKILTVLRDWLGLIPGVNKYFLEQESKLKTDKIMAIARKTQGNIQE